MKPEQTVPLLAEGDAKAAVRAAVKGEKGKPDKRPPTLRGAGVCSMRGQARIMPGSSCAGHIPSGRCRSASSSGLLSVSSASTARDSAGVVQDRQRPARDAWSGLLDMQRNRIQHWFRDVKWPFRTAIPITDIESPPAFPADDVLHVKPLVRSAIEAVRFNGTGNPALAE
jgi:hypothetical protein